MTSKTVKKEETLIQQELANLKAKFPNWDFGYELNETITDLVSVIKEAIKEVKIKFPNYKFSVCKNSYGYLLLLNIKPIDKDETFAYYGGMNSGYIVDNGDYYHITNEFVHNSNIDLYKISVHNFIENSKTMQIAFKKY